MKNFKVLMIVILFSFGLNNNASAAYIVNVEDGADKPAFYHNAKKKADKNARYIKIKKKALERMTPYDFDGLETILIGVLHMDEKSQSNYLNYILESTSTNSNPDVSAAQILDIELMNPDGSMKTIDEYLEIAKDLMETGNDLDKLMGGMFEDIFGEDNLYKKNGERKSDGQLRGEFIGSVIGGIGGFVLGVIIGKPVAGAKTGIKVGKLIGGFFGKLFSKKDKKKNGEEEEPEAEVATEGVWAGPNNDEPHYGGMAWPF